MCVGTESIIDLHNRFNSPTATVIDIQEAQAWTIMDSNVKECRSQWPRGLRRSSVAVRLLVLLVRIPPGALMFVSCECCVLSGRGLSVGLINPDKFYRVWSVLGWSWRPFRGGHCQESDRSATGGETILSSYLQNFDHTSKRKKKYNLQLWSSSLYNFAYCQFRSCTWKTNIFVIYFMKF